MESPTTDFKSEKMKHNNNKGKFFYRVLTFYSIGTTTPAADNTMPRTNSDPSRHGPSVNCPQDAFGLVSWEMKDLMSSPCRMKLPMTGGVNWPWMHST